MELQHPLLEEFPQYKDLIIRLRDENAHFRVLYDEYHAVDERIERIELDKERATDQELESLKLRRVGLKDALFHILRVSRRNMPAVAA